MGTFPELRDDKKESGYSEVLKCSKSTKKRIMGDCCELFLRQHPEFLNTNLTHNFILDKISRRYLNQPSFPIKKSTWGLIKTYVTEGFKPFFK